ncbi:UNVERIFIED_CONTAM: hypothetical protein GTU68_031004 [Idotea baltica]|nr:hypothetical protein [Idotea baltica]
MALSQLVKDIRQCEICREHLPLGPRPIVQLPTTAKIAVLGQAPGRITHESGTPWDDASGRRLRDWLGVDDDTFYHSGMFALMPMGFCYPGTGKSGDLPPRKECAETWHEKAFAHLENVSLYLVIGAYAQKYYLAKKMHRNLTETVRHYHEYLPEYFPLVHPSPRNFRWEKKNPWFVEDVLPMLKAQVDELIR